MLELKELIREHEPIAFLIVIYKTESYLNEECCTAERFFTNVLFDKQINETSSCIRKRSVYKAVHNKHI